MRNKPALIAGFSVSLVFMILTGVNAFITGMSADTAETKYYAIIIVEIIAFLLPSVLMSVAKRFGAVVDFRIRGFNSKAIGFIIKFSVAVSLLSFLANYAVGLLSPSTAASSDTAASFFQGSNVWLEIFAIAIIPAIVEEIFMRGALFSAYETCGTWVGILMSGLAFAMIHASLSNFVGPLLAGIAYAYLTYTLDSIWPAILAHLINNLFYILMNSLMMTYSAFGIWPYFLAVSVLVFLLLAYLSLRSLEKLIKKGLIAKFKKGSRNFAACLLETILSPGFLLFITVFLLRIALDF